MHGRTLSHAHSHLRQEVNGTDCRVCFWLKTFDHKNTVSDSNMSEREYIWTYWVTLCLMFISVEDFRFWSRLSEQQVRIAVTFGSWWIWCLYSEYTAVLLCGILCSIHCSLSLHITEDIHSVKAYTALDFHYFHSFIYLRKIINRLADNGYWLVKLSKLGLIFFQLRKFIS